MQDALTAHPLAMEMEFTETYRRYQNDHPALREAMCLRVQYPALLQDIREDDEFAGRADCENGSLGVGFLMQAGFGVGYVCSESNLRGKLHRLGVAADCEADLQALLHFWRERTTESHFYPNLDSSQPENIRRAVPERYVDGEPMLGSFVARTASINLDFDKLLRLGIPGLRDEVERCREKASRDGGDEELFEGMRLCLDLLTDVCLWYAGQAREKGLLEMAAALESIAVSPPGTLREAIQLFWLYAMLAHITNYGRMDVCLGDFLARDLDAGRLSEEEALSLVESLWGMIASLCGAYSGRVTIGGMGRRNEKNADRFALLALEATRRTARVSPQLTLRVYRGMNPALLDRAISVLGHGLTFPILLNDDASIPAMQRAMSASREEAEQYLVSNCGDAGLDHMSFGSPNSNIYLAKILEIVLHNGNDPVSGRPMGLQTGEFASFETFDQLLAAFRKQVEFFVDLLAKRHELFNKTLGENPFLFVSMLSDDCLARGKSAFAGGLRYCGGLTETYGNITSADSLTAIREVVYDRKLFTQEQLLAALDANFDGYARERALLRQLPKFGNDDPAADAMAGVVNDIIFSAIASQKHKTDMDFMMAEYVNAGGHIPLGLVTAASADGRLAGAPLANANNPTAGNDRNGVTAALNSMAKLDISPIGPGVFQSAFLDRGLFTAAREKVKSLLETFFARGGAMIHVTATSREDLQNALREPDKYPNLVVRVGGYSARFMELDKQTQEDIVSRSVH